MHKPNTLLFIDSTPVHSDLISYFAKFDFQIIEKSTLPAPAPPPKLPTALLVDWSIICKHRAQLQKMLPFYKTIPFIILSGDTQDNTCINALEQGADDFVLKTRPPRELHARINAVLRRIKRFNPQQGEKDVLLFDNWRLYPGSRQLYRGELEYHLSPSEYNLLLAMVQQTHQILSRKYLWNLIGQQTTPSTNRGLDIQISRLRQKIETDPKHPRLIKTVRNQGYLFCAAVVSSKET